MNKDLVTGFNMSSMVQHLVSRDPVKDQRDSSLQINSFGNAHQKSFGKVDQLSLSIVFGKACNPIADFEFAAAFTVEAHLADDAVARCKRGLSPKGISATTHVN